MVAPRTIVLRHQMQQLGTVPCAQSRVSWPGMSISVAQYRPS